MVLIHTAIDGLDEKLKESIPNSKIAYYAEFLLEDEKADTIILSYNIKTQVPLKDFLFALRQKDRRVVLLLDSEQSPVLGYALALGIYDIVFGKVTPDKISSMVLKPNKFSDVAPLFLGLKGGVSYRGSIDESQQDETEESNSETVYKEPLENTEESNNDKTNVSNSVDQVLLGILKFLGAKKLSKDTVSNLLLLEDLVIEKTLT